MKSYAIAVLVAAVSGVDLEVDHGSSWGSYSPYSYQAPTQSYSSPYNHGHTTSHSYQAPQPSHGHTSHGHTSHTNAYAIIPKAKTWKTAFEPAELEHDEYGICSFKDASDTTYTMTFYQKEGEATQVWGAIEGPNVSKSYGAKFDFTIHEYGTKAGTNCSKVGDTWLPDQGKLESQWITNNAYGAFTWEQPSLEQNLGGGHEKLFARTIRVTADGYNNGQPATAIIGCCVIAEAAHPDNENHHHSPVGDTNTKVAKAQTHGHSHGHTTSHSKPASHTHGYVATAQPTTYGTTSTAPYNPAHAAPSHGHPGHGTSFGHSTVHGAYAKPSTYGSTSSQPLNSVHPHKPGHPGHGSSFGHSTVHGSYSQPTTYGSTSSQPSAYPYAASSHGHPGHGGSFGSYW